MVFLHFRGAAATATVLALAVANREGDPSWVDCWGRGDFDKADCCQPGAEGALAAATFNCWDSVFSRRECCGSGRARIFPDAESELPAWEDAARWAATSTSIAAEHQAALSQARRIGQAVHSGSHPSFSSEQRRWEASMQNSSEMISSEVLGHRLHIWIFKRSGPAFDEVMQELKGDLYRFHQIKAPSEAAFAVDVGASVGAVSILMSKLWNTIRVVALEPAPANYRYLLWNLRVNGVADRVWPLNVAMGGAPELSQIFFYSPTYPTWSQTCGEGKECEKEAKDEVWRGGWTDWQVRFEVGVVTLAEVLAALRIRELHFLKVDCEGCEWAVFAPPSWPRLQHLVRHAAAELHRWALEGPMASTAEAAVREAICMNEKNETGNDENSVCSTG